MKTQGIETTELQDIMIGFLEQNREGMVSLLEWFLNSVMEMEVEQQANASLYERCGGISASAVSAMSKELDVKVDEFLDRRIDSEMPYLIVDATYFKVRDGPKHVSKALFIVAGVGLDGRREILGAKIADAETELLWEGYFDELKERGLHGVRMVISMVTRE
jgi:putative transposase